jgi:hypothetical protein
MTDIRDELARLLDNEPQAPDQIGLVVTRGRRALRRRTVLTAVAGTAGTAAVTAAVVVPITATGGGNGTGSIRVGTTAPPVACRIYYAIDKGGHREYKKNLASVIRQWRQSGHRDAYTLRTKKMPHGAEMIRICAGPQPGPIKNPAAPKPPALSGPRYTYTEMPTDIADRLGSHLVQSITADNLDIVFKRSFAQESSKLDSGHPNYYDGNVDVSLAGGNQGDIGVQVTHEVTTQVPFDGTCEAPKCVETTLPDGSILRTDQVDPGGGLILTAEVHRPDGVVVHAQESNYGFGPNAPVKQYGDQPLTLQQLTALAEDPAFTF